jgi:hypothetical protein
VTRAEVLKLYPNASESMIRRNLELETAPEQCSAVFATAFKPTIAASTDEGKLNKTERARLEYLRRLPHVKSLHIQAVTVKIGNDCRFTPDFFYFDANRERLIAEDTKGGHVWEDSRIKAKAAARMFPEFTFIVAYKENGGWREEEIKP